MTYNQILIKTGISDDDLNFVRRDQEQYLEKLKEVSEQLGYVPSVNQFISLGYSPSILAKYLRLYDINLREVYSRYSTQDLLKYKLQ